MADRALSQPRRHRLEVRVTPEQDALIREAAGLRDRTVTAFVLDAVTAKAARIVRDHRDLVVSEAAYDLFLAELDKPPAPVPELTRLFEGNPKLPEA